MDVLRQLQTAKGLFIDCPECTEPIRLCDALLFDAKRRLPAEVSTRIETKRADLFEELKEVRRERRALSERAFRAAASGRVGKRLEMLAASLPGLPANPRDCRALGDPIDYLAFEGASRGHIDAVHFIEVKSSKAPLSAIQRAIRAAVERGHVSLNVANHRLCIAGESHE